MPLAEELGQFARGRGIGEFWDILKRTFAPTADVLSSMGPVTNRLGQDMRMIDDDTARGVGEYFDRVNLDRWRQVDPQKRVTAGMVRGGLLSPEERVQAMADPDIAGMVDDMGWAFSRANEQNVNATSFNGDPLKVRNSLTGDWEPYEGIPEDYFPRFVKRSKRDAILNPMNDVQTKLEQRLTADRLQTLGMDKDALLNSDQADEIRKVATESINEFFRTGQANPILKDSDLLRTMKPAYDTFQELHQHFEDLAARRAARVGQPPPLEMDPILQLFGSQNPDDTRAGIRLLKDFLLRDAQNARRFGSIEASRQLLLPRDWYESDPLKIVPLYLLRQQRRLAEIARFGQDNEAVLHPTTGALTQIPDENDRIFAKKAFDRFMGLEPYNKSIKMNNLMDWIFASQVLKLGTAQISQLGQVMNSILETGLGPTWHALTNLGKSRDIALRSGASLSHVMDIVREGLSDPLEQSMPRQFTENFLHWTGFNKADLIARHIGAGAGYAYGQQLLQRVLNSPDNTQALRELRRLTPGALKDDALFQPLLQKIMQFRQTVQGRADPAMIEQYFQKELDNMARTASLNANFRQTILDLPLWASSPLGRTVAMFRTFAYKQTDFMRKRIMEDWRQGNPRPLIALAAGAGAIGPMITAMKAIPHGRIGETVQDYQDAKNDPVKMAQLAVENIATVGGLGLFDQMLRALRRGDVGWWEFVGGPLFTDVNNLVSGTGQLALGVTPLGEPGMAKMGAGELGKFAAQHIPIVGSGLAHAGRAIMEPVERLPSGQVVRDKTQLLGEESPPLEIGGLRLPSAKILLGTEESALAKRKRYLDGIKSAIMHGDTTRAQKLLKDALLDKVNISPSSINRFLREAQKEAQDNQ